MGSGIFFLPQLQCVVIVLSRFFGRPMWVNTSGYSSHLVGKWPRALSIPSHFQADLKTNPSPIDFVGRSLSPLPAHFSPTGYGTELKEIAGVFCDAQRVRDCRFLGASDYQESGASELDSDRDLAHNVFMVQVNIIGFRLCGHLSMQYTMPAKFAQLLSPDAVVVKDALAEVSTWFAALEKLEKDMHSDGEMMDLHAALVWPSLHWNRVLLVGLAEASFKSVPNWVREKLMSLFRGYGTTKCIEDMFKILRKAESSSNENKDVSKEQRWYSVAQCAVLKDSDRRPLHITPSAIRGARSTAPPASIYDPEASPMSLGEDVLKRLASGAFKSQAPKTSNTTFLCWMAILKYEGERDTLNILWLSLLAQPGWVLKHLPTNSYKVVLFSSQSGILLWNLDMFVMEQGRFFRLRRCGGECWSFDTLQNLDEWEGLNHKVVAPGECVLLCSSSGLESSGPGLMLQEVGRQSLLEKAARSALVPLLIVHLKKLFHHLGLAKKGTRVPNTEKTLVTALVSHILPKASEAELKSIFDLRFGPEVEDEQSLLKDPGNLD